MRRVLVTGSRFWDDVAGVELVLEELMTRVPRGCELVVVHGDCPSGADRIAKLWARRHPWAREEPHPAEWKRLGRGAGPIRNQQMVNLGADLCLAFLTATSQGTRDCVERARRFGIPVVEVWPKSPSRL